MTPVPAEVFPATPPAISAPPPRTVVPPAPFLPSPMMMAPQPVSHPSPPAPLLPLPMTPLTPPVAAADAPFIRTNRLMIQAAARLGVEARELSDVHSDQFLRLSRGGHSVVVCKTRSPWLTVTAQHLANNKHVSRSLLRAAGVPTVADRVVEKPDDAAERVEIAQFLAAAEAVMVKPNWGNRGVGVIGPLREVGTVLAALRRACEMDFDEEALLEPFLPGPRVRATVIGGRFAAAAHVIHARLMGDGVATVAELVERFNADPRRGAYMDGVLCSLDKMEPDEDFDAYLEVLGLSMDAVLAPEHVLPLWIEEEEIIDITDEFPAAARHITENACAALGVDVGGVDWIFPDATWEPSRGRVLEVNVLPALHLHALPTRGAPRPVFEAFVAYAMGLPLPSEDGALRAE